MSSVSPSITRSFESSPRDAETPSDLKQGDWSDFQFVSRWATNTLGEHWHVQSSGSDLLAHLVSATEPELIANAKTKLGELHHPNLCPYAFGPANGGRMLLTTPRPQQTIWDWYHQYWRSRSSGIPRSQLLDYWCVIAETLDAAAKEHQLFHLWLHPRLLTLCDNRVQIAGLGLPDLFLRPLRIPLANLNPRYAAPEISLRRPVSRADQYSLAVMYGELACGVYPFRTQKDRIENRPDFGLLSSDERDVIQRAVQSDPRRRFPTCLAFVRALLEAQPEEHFDPFRPELVICETPNRSLKFAPPDVMMDHFTSELVALAIGPNQQESFKHIRYTMHPDHIEHHYVARMFPGAAPLKLDGFRQQWRAKPLVEEESRGVFQVNLATPLWKRLLGRGARLEIDVAIIPADRHRCTSDVSVTLRPIGCSPQDAKAVLRKRGLEVLDSLRMFLQAQPDQREGERIPYIHTARIRPVVGGVIAPDVIECLTKDVSPGGIGLFLPQICDTSSIYINLPNVAQIADYAGLARIVRKSPCRDGWYELGALFETK